MLSRKRDYNFKFALDYNTIFNLRKPDAITASQNRAYRQLYFLGKIPLFELAIIYGTKPK